MVGLHQLAQTALEVTGQTAAQQRNTNEPFACTDAVPAQVVLQLGLGLNAQALDGVGEVLGLEFLLEPANALVVDQVLQTGVPSVAAVTVIPLQGKDRLHQVKDVLRCHIAQGISGAGEGFLFLVGAAHATTHIDIAAPQFAIGVGEGHEANVLGEKVNGVIARDRDGHLEFAREVGASVEGFVGITAEDPTFLLA